MIIPAKEIYRRLTLEVGDPKDPLVITPFPSLEGLSTSGAASIDLRLGTWFVSPRPQSTDVLDVARLKSEDRTEADLTKTSYYRFGKRFILHPRNFVLAGTLEWIRLPGDLCGMVSGKSSWGRRGLVIATATGVHPRFIGCLTLELANVGEVPIAIYPGMHICQLFLQEVSPVSEEMDKSTFVGFGRPTLGTIRIDRVAEKLREE